MKESLLEYLECVSCHSSYQLDEKERQDDEVWTGSLTCRCEKPIPIISGVPRFVAEDSYTNSFSLEWTVFRKTQVEQFNQSTHMAGETTKELQDNLDFPLAEMKDKLALDVGCGPGRFSEVLLENGATVIALDYSFAVDTAYKNLRSDNNFHVLQADLFAAPLKKKLFDLVISMGVLHHTPDPPAGFQKISPLVAPTGKISIRVYDKHYRHGLNTYYRVLTKRLPRRLLLFLCLYSIPWHFVARGPLKHLGKILLHLHIRHWKWRYLDTFDYFSPWFQFYYEPSEVKEWYKKAGLVDVKNVCWGSSIIGRRPEY